MREELIEIQPLRNGCYSDHLGNYYGSIPAMCECWGVAISTFQYRIENGFGLEKSLTHKNSKTIPDKDESLIYVFGEPFSDYHAVDDAYGYAFGISARHKENLEEWLLSKQLFYVDNKLFRSISALSIEYGIGDSTIQARLNAGWSLWDAVHKPKSNKGLKGRPCEDHLGNKYSSVTNMLVHYKITYACYRKRILRGHSLEYTLTTPMKSYLSREIKKKSVV